MPKTSNLNILIDEDMKNTAEQLYSKYGLSLAQAVTIFIHQSCNVGGLPFDLRPKAPNPETIEAMQEANLITNNPDVNYPLA